MKEQRLPLWIGGAFLGAFILVLLLPLATSPTPLGGILTCIPFGWWHFLQRNVPELTVNWNLIATGLICSVLAVGLANWLFGAVWSQVQSASHPNQPVRRWPWRWTVCVYCGIWLLFLTAFGAAGVLRHTTWLMAYDQPWYQERMHSYVELRMADARIQELMLDTAGDLESTRKAFLSEKSYRRSRSLMAEEFDVIFYASSGNKVAAYLIIPRKPQLGGKGQFGASVDGKNGILRPISELQKTMTELDPAYPH